MSFALTANIAEAQVADLQNGVAVAGLAGAEDSALEYKLNVPAGAVVLQIALSGGSGDCDLYVRYGARATTSAYDYAPWLGGNDDFVTIASPDAGDWYIMVYGKSVYAGVTLLATYADQGHTVTTVSDSPAGGETSNDSGATNGIYRAGFRCTVTAYPYYGHNFLNWTEDGTVVSDSADYTFTVTGDRTLTANFGEAQMIELQNGVTVTSLAGAQDSATEYWMAVPAGAASLQISISGGNGECDLYVRRGARASRESYDYRSSHAGNNETVTIANPAVGNWHIMLHGSDYYSGVTLRLLYTFAEHPLALRFPPELDAALETVGTYDGYLYGQRPFGGDALPTLLGTLNVKVRNLNGRLTAKATVQSGYVSFRGNLWKGRNDATGTLNASLEARSRSGEVLDLFVRQNRIWGTLKGGKFGEQTLYIEGARNRFADKKDAAAQDALNRHKGYYTATLSSLCRNMSFVQGSLNAAAAQDALNRHNWLYTAKMCTLCGDMNFVQGSLNAAPHGYGYLTLKVKKLNVNADRKVKIAGVLADGTKVARRTQLLWFSDGGEWFCAPFFVPLYRKTGYISGLFWINPATWEVYCGAETGEAVRWEKPGKSPDGFTGLLDIWGSAYAPVPALSGMYLFDAYLDYASSAYHYKGGAADCQFWPAGVTVDVTGSKLKIAKGVKPEKIREDGETRYEYGGVNPNMVTLNFTARTGIFKGQYKLYYDYDNANGRLRHKTVKVPYVGVMLTDPETGMVVSGYGHSLFRTKDPDLKAYKVKPSFPVSLLTP